MHDLNIPYLQFREHWILIKKWPNCDVRSETVVHRQVSEDLSEGASLEEILLMWLRVDVQQWDLSKICSVSHPKHRLIRFPTLLQCTGTIASTKNNSFYIAYQKCASGGKRGRITQELGL